MAASPGLSQHRTVEALKSAFALRMHLGDPGNCTDASNANCYLDLAPLVSDALSPSFADSLRWACRLITIKGSMSFVTC